jgi:hypothetical protein
MRGELYRTRDELIDTREEVNRTHEKLAQTRHELHRSQDEFEGIRDELYQTQDELLQAYAELERTVGELYQLQRAWLAPAPPSPEALGALWVSLRSLDLNNLTASLTGDARRRTAAFGSGESSVFDPSRTSNEPTSSDEQTSSAEQESSTEQWSSWSSSAAFQDFRNKTGQRLDKLEKTNARLAEEIAHLRAKRSPAVSDSDPLSDGSVVFNPRDRNNKNGVLGDGRPLSGLQAKPEPEGIHCSPLLLPEAELALEEKSEPFEHPGEKLVHLHHSLDRVRRSTETTAGFTVVDKQCFTPRKFYPLVEN